MANVEIPVKFPGLDKLLAALNAMGERGEQSAGQIVDGLKQATRAAEETAKATEKIGENTKKSADTAGELDKLFKKNFGVEAFVGSLNRASGALAAVGTGGAASAARGIGAISTLAQGLGQGGPAGLAVAAFSVAVQQLGSYWEIEAQKEQAAHEFGIAQMREQTKAAQDLKAKLIEIATQEDALAIQQKDRVSGAVAVAQARVRSAQKEAADNDAEIEAQKTRLANAKQQLKNAALEQQKLDYNGPSLPYGTSTIGFAAYNARGREQTAINDLKARATNDLNDAKAQLETLGGKVSIIGDKVRALAEDAAEVAKVELKNALDAQSISLAKSEQAVRALNLTRTEGIPGTLAAIQAEREYLAAYSKQPENQRDPAFFDKGVRDARLRVLTKEEERVKTQDLTTAEQGLKKAQADSAIAVQALTNQYRTGTPAAVANAKAQLDYFIHHQEMFPQFYSAELRRIEITRRRGEVDRAVTAGELSAIEANRVALQQFQQEQRVAEIEKERSVSTARAQAIAAIEAMKANEDRLVSEKGFVAYTLDLGLAEQRLASIERNELTAARREGLTTLADVSARSRELADNEKVLAEMARTGKTEDEARRVVTLQLAEAELKRLQIAAQFALLTGDDIAKQKANDALLRARIALDNQKTENDQTKLKTSIEMSRQRDLQARADAANGLGTFGSGFALRAEVLERGTDGVLRLKEGAYAAAGAFRALGEASELGFQAVGDAVGKGLESLATYSRAQQEVAKAQKLSSEETRAAVAAEVQSILAGIAKQAGVKAVFELGEGIAAVASYRYDAATEHFAASAIYGGIAIGTAVTGAAIGSARGNTRDENEQIKQAQQGSGSGGYGGYSGGSGDRGAVTYNVYNGPYLPTETKFNKKVYNGYERQKRLR